MSYDDYEYDDGRRRRSRRRDDDDYSRSSSRGNEKKSSNRNRDRSERDRRSHKDDDWNDRAGLNDQQQAYTPSAGRRRQNSRGSSRNGSDEGEGESPELAARVEALEEQVRSLKHQNRMFLTFMQATEERLTVLREQRKASGARTPREGGRDGRSTPRGRPESRGGGSERGPERTDELDEGEKRRRAIARTKKRAQEKRRKQAEEKRQQEEPEEEEEPPPRRAPQRKPPPKRQSAPSPKAERALGGGSGGASIYEQAARNPDAFMEEQEMEQAPANLKPCGNCGRKFNPEALKRHKQKKICQKKARKVFNMADRRVEEKVAGGSLNSRGKKKEPPKKKSNWRHERAKLQQAIQAGKAVTAAIKSGKDLSSLPPPPPTDPSLDDRTPCPHCSRKFNQQAAERHIPHCAKKNSRMGPPPRGRKAATSKAKGRGAPVRRR